MIIIVFVCIYVIIGYILNYRSTEEALGDVIGRLAPFLKLYSTYTAGFEDAMKTLTEVSKKDRKFDTLVREFEVRSGRSLK